MEGNLIVTLPCCAFCIVNVPCLKSLYFWIIYCCPFSRKVVSGLCTGIRVLTGSGKHGKMRQLFPVRKKSGNFEKMSKSQGILSEEKNENYRVPKFYGNRFVGQVIFIKVILRWSWTRNCNDLGQFLLNKKEIENRWFDFIFRNLIVLPYKNTSKENESQYKVCACEKSIND